jgi:hypothetical protein
MSDYLVTSILLSAVLVLGFGLGIGVSYFIDAGPTTGAESV